MDTQTTENTNITDYSDRQTNAMDTRNASSIEVYFGIVLGLAFLNILLGIIYGLLKYFSKPKRGRVHGDRGAVGGIQRTANKQNQTPRKANAHVAMFAQRNRAVQS